MTRRKRRPPPYTKSGSNTPDSPIPAAPPPAGAAANHAKVSLPAVLKAAFERAADMAKRALGSQGTVAPMAVFAYRGEPGHREGNGDEFKSVSLVWRTELQKETIKRRIKEKASAERASAVVVLTRAETEGAGAQAKASSQQKGMLVFSGATPHVRASAKVTYVLEKEAKTLSSWEMRVSAEPEETFFLEGVFADEKPLFFRRD